MDKPEGYTFGRPTKYKPEYCQAIIEHFNVPHTKTGIVETRTDHNDKETTVEKTMGNDFPTMAGFCAKLMISKQTLIRWVEAHEEFSDAYRIGKGIQEDMLVNNAMTGAYSGSFPAFFAKNALDYEDVQKTKDLGPDDVDGNDEKQALQAIGVRVKEMGDKDATPSKEET